MGLGKWIGSVKSTAEGLIELPQEAWQHSPIGYAISAIAQGTFNPEANIWRPITLDNDLQRGGALVTAISLAVISGGESLIGDVGAASDYAGPVVGEGVVLLKRLIQKVIRSGAFVPALLFLGPFVPAALFHDRTQRPNGRTCQGCLTPSESRRRLALSRLLDTGNDDGALHREAVPAAHVDPHDGLCRPHAA